MAGIWVTDKVKWFLLLILAGCQVTKIDGECYYEREVKTLYYCEPGGKLEQFKVQPVE